MGSPLLACLLLVLAIGGCGERAPLPDGCLSARADDVLAALQRAPGPVALADGTPISTCVARAVDDTELQAVGATLTAAADRLARRGEASGAAALRLGFLIGAIERGAAQTAGIQDELRVRLERAAAGGGSQRAALLRGRAAGRRHG